MPFTTEQFFGVFLSYHEALDPETGRPLSFQ